MKFPVYTWILFITLLACLFGDCQGWTNEDLEIFDLVEEVPVNFYDFMGVLQVSNDSSKLFISSKIHVQSISLLTITLMISIRMQPVQKSEKHFVISP